ncbi:MAG: NAD(+)/NADH kinase [Calditrichaeota bacterium]|nr:NAD(+)/NADH kinase [Calditrichota bacterium]MCB9473421.1 NAD(+)/NADH kinase [Candidatus Delongbacteria bacterium]
MIFGITGSARSRDLRSVLPELLETLERLGQQAVLDHALAVRCWPEDLPEDLELVDARELSAHCDLVISMGGDGSMLGAVRQMVVDRPVLGLHMGRLGYLTALAPEELESGLKRVIAGRAIEQPRMMLQMEIGPNLADASAGKVRVRRDALNDIVIHSARPARILRLRTRIDHVNVFGLEGDGLIHSTPTGSSAYSLSGGGPIMDPSMQAIILTPSMAHSISHRPMVIGAESVIESWIGTPSSPLIVTVDGQETFRLKRSEHVRVRRSSRICRLITLDEQGFLKTLRNKLKWNLEGDEPA